MLSKSDRIIFKQTYWLSLIMAVQVIFGFMRISLSVRILGVEGYGSLAVIISISSLIHGLLALPGGDTITTFAVRSLSKQRQEEAVRILRFSLVVSFLLSLVAYLVIVVLTLFSGDFLGLGEIPIRSICLYGIVGILLATQTETLAVLRLADKISLCLIINLASSLVNIILLYMAWLNKSELDSIILAYIVSAGINGIGMFIAVVIFAPKASLPNFLKSFSIKVPSDVIKFHIGKFGRMTIGTLIHNIDTILLAKFSGLVDVGQYRAASQIIETSKRPFQPIMNGVRIEYSKQWYSFQGKALRRTSLRFTLLSFTLAFIGFGLLILLNQSIVELALGKSFLGSIPILLIMIPGSFAAASISPLSVLPEATGYIWPSLLAPMLGFIVFLVVAWQLLPNYGAKGMAWANTSYFITFSVVTSLFVISILRQSYWRTANNEE